VHRAQAGEHAALDLGFQFGLADAALPPPACAGQQLPPPISEEFGRVIFNVNLGMPISDAMMQMSQRVQSYEYDMMVSAVTIQLEVGGSITELLDSIADTIRDRSALRGEMRALTAQGRLSGILLSLMPVALFILMLFLNRPYADLLLKDELGRKILNACVAMELVGWTIINRILNVRV
jgi:tight adherence protein B